jgi:RecB family exonuclease
VWGELGFEATWQSRAERDAASAALKRFLEWHLGRPERRLVASEHGFEVLLDVGEQGVRVRGKLDRVEVDADGKVHVVDLKTQKNKETVAGIASHAQLGLYQRSMLSGGLDAVPDDVREASGLPPAGEPVAMGGAELVLLRIDDSGLPLVQAQQGLPDGETWVDDLVVGAEARVRSELFVALPNEYCRFCAYRRSCPASEEGGEVLA